MNYFDVRRARVKPAHAHLYPELTEGVWLSARRVTRLVGMAGPRRACQEHGCARGRVLCELHFEFRGGRRGRQCLTGIRLQRVTAALPGTARAAEAFGEE